MSGAEVDAVERRREDLAIAVDLIVRSVAPIDGLIAALERAGGSARLVRALRAELAARRGNKRIFGALK